MEVSPLDLRLACAGQVLLHVNHILPLFAVDYIEVQFLQNALIVQVLVPTATEIYRVSKPDKRGAA